MAKFDGIANRVLTSQEAAMYASMTLWHGDAVMQQVNSRPLLRAMLGKAEVAGTKVFANKRGEEQVLNKMRPVNAYPADQREIDWAIQFGRSTGSTLTVATSTGAKTTKTIDTVRRGHQYTWYYFDHLEWSRLFELWKSRQISQTEVELKIKAMVEGYLDALETQIFLAEATPSSAGVGGEAQCSCLDFLASDGLTAANRATYYATAGQPYTNSDTYTGTVDDTNYKQFIVDRSATGNEPARAIVRKPAGNLSELIIQQYARMLGNNGADRNSLVLWTNEAQYDILSSSVYATPSSGNTMVEQEFMQEKVMTFGLQEYIIIANNVIVACDRKIDTSRSYLLDMSAMVMAFDVLDTETLKRPDLNYANTTNFIAGAQLLTNRPGSLMKILR